MNCPYCGSSQIDVANSRPSKNNVFWRRRNCRKCHKSYTTYEIIDLSHLVVQKKSGKRQKFSKWKLYASVYHPCVNHKDIDRGDVSMLAAQITENVMNQILLKDSKIIKSTEIEEIVLEIFEKTAKSSMLSYLAYRESNNEKQLNLLVKKYLLV